MIDLKPDEWVLLSLGAFDELREKISKEPGREEVLLFLEKCTSHLNSKEEFKKRYNFDVDKEIEFPPEYFTGFPLDKRLEIILDLIKKYQAKDILDIGSRAGYLLFAARKNNDIDSGVGVDVDTSLINLSKKAAKLFGFIDLEFHNTLFEDFESNRKFDALIIADVLEHVIDPELFIQRSLKFVKDSGVLIISVPVNRLLVKDVEKETIMSWGQQEHVHLLKLDTLKNICTKVGYEFVEHQLYAGLWEIDISVFKPY